MSTRISILHFPEQEKSHFIDLIESQSCCMRCGSSNKYKKNKLPAYLNQLQHLSGRYKLSYPTELYYFFKTSNTETETLTKGIFKKREVTTTKEFGSASLYLEFKDDLTEEEQDKWVLVAAGVFAAIKALS